METDEVQSDKKKPFIMLHFLSDAVTCRWKSSLNNKHRGGLTYAAVMSNKAAYSIYGKYDAVQRDKAGSFRLFMITT